MICEKICRRYCYEDLSMIEGYEEAVSSSKRWDCHHRVESIMNCGQKELKAKGCYYHRPAHELIFLSHSEHRRIHNLGNKVWLGKHHSEESKEKLRLANLGKKLSEETKEKNRQAHLGKRHSEETKEKLRQANSGTNSPIYGAHWWNDGKSEILRKECPGAGWKRGRLRTEE